MMSLGQMETMIWKKSTEAMNSEFMDEYIREWINNSYIESFWDFLRIKRSFIQAEEKNINPHFLHKINNNF